MFNVNWSAIGEIGGIKRERERERGGGRYTYLRWPSQTTLPLKVEMGVSIPCPYWVKVVVVSWVQLSVSLFVHFLNVLGVERPSHSISSVPNV